MASVTKPKFVWVDKARFQEPGYGLRFQAKFHAACSAVTRGFAVRVQEYARSHAPWEDRTGDARDGLTAEGDFSFVSYTITLYHTVDYGIWLETRWHGKYAIILPTIEVMGPRFMAELAAAEVMGVAVL